MGYETVETIQCQLGDTGVILFPVVERRIYPAPLFIDDEDIVRLDLRLFPRANLNGRVYKYSRNEQARRWTLDR